VKKEKDSLEAYQHKEYKANKKIPVGFPHQGEERSPKEVASEMARNIREQEEYEQGYHPSGYGYGGSR
jgi:hypothetical protein